MAGNVRGTGCGLLPACGRVRYPEEKLASRQRRRAGRCVPGRGVPGFCGGETRTGNGYGGARRAVNARKRALIRRGAAEWLRLLPEPVNSRYDVVEVLYREGMPPEFRHIRGAFGAKDLPAS